MRLVAVLALSEAGSIALISAILSAGTLIAVALIGRRTHKQLKPENGHPSLGGGLAAVEDRLIENIQRTDRIETKLDSHIEDTAPLLERAIRDWGPEGTKGEP